MDNRRTQTHGSLDYMGLSDSDSFKIGCLLGFCEGCKKLKMLVFRSLITDKFYCCEFCCVKREQGGL